jgi:hypothetical protein
MASAMAIRMPFHGCGAMVCSKFPVLAGQGILAPPLAIFLRRQGRVPFHRELLYPRTPTALMTGHFNMRQRIRGLIEHQVDLPGHQILQCGTRRMG